MVAPPNGHVDCGKWAVQYQYLLDSFVKIDKRLLNDRGRLRTRIDGGLISGHIVSTMSLTWMLRTSGTSWRPRVTRARGGTAARAPTPTRPAGRGGRARGSGRARRRRGRSPGAGRTPRNSDSIEERHWFSPIYDSSYATRRKSHHVNGNCKHTHSGCKVPSFTS